MNIINWQQFGLKKNPYNIQPLVEGGDLPIEKAFIGREKEIKYLNDLFANEDRLCLTLCGNVGVGKTSLANFVKFINKYSQQKLLFSPRREIEASIELLNKKNFIIEIIGSTIKEIKLLQRDLLKDDLMKKLIQIVDISDAISFSGSLSGGLAGYSAGIGASKEKISTQPLQLSMSILEDYFVKMIELIKTHEINGFKYSGLIVHVNNFDVLMAEPENKKKLIQFFNDIRDLLQFNDVYYFFLGPTDLFKNIISVNARVKSVFVGQPIQVAALSKTEIIDALNERMSLLKSDNVKNYLKPIEDNVVFRLYDLYQGDIRSIMKSIKDIIGQSPGSLSRPLNTNEAMVMLGQERWEQIENNFNLKDEQKKVLALIANSQNYVCQKNIADNLKKDRANISGYYFKPLIDLNIIEVKDKKGKTPYWGLTKEFEPLKWYIDARKEVQREIKKSLKQPTLFS